MMNHEAAVNAIREAREVLSNIEVGASANIAGEKAFELLLLSMELDGDDKNAVYAVARALDSVASHPSFVSDEKALALAIGVLDSQLGKAAQIAAEEWILKDGNKDIETGEESLYDLLASLDDDFDFDDEETCGASDVEYEYNNATEMIKERLESLENKLFEYEYGSRKNDDDAYEQAYQLKENIQYAKKKQNEIEDLLESYKSGEIDAWTAQDKIFQKAGMID